MKITTAISFGDIALQRGLISKEMLQEALLLHAVASKRRQNVSLAQVMVQSGFLSPEQAQEIERQQQQILHAQAEADLPEDVSSAMQVASNRIGKFVKLELLGRGGVGEVWKAYDLVIRRAVAIKFLHTLTPEHWQRFVKEAQILGRLQHPNIVPLYEIGDRFIVMPHIHGRTLDRVKMSIAQAAEAIRQACAAIAHAHSQGVVHRDIKPSNILLEGRTVYVTDFGIAKELQVKESLSTTGDILGTPSYMSPEQVRARTHQIDPRTDVYALGATLYHLVTGTVAFCNEDLYEMLRAIQEDDPVRPSRLNPEVPRDLEAVILKAMEKSPARRYSGARDMAADLERFLKGEPVLARPSGSFERGLRRLERHKATTLLGSVAVVGLAFGLYGMTRSDPPPPSKPAARQNYDAEPPSAYYGGKGPSNPAPLQMPYGGQELQRASDRSISDAHINRTNELIQMNKLDDALASAHQAVEADPRHAGAYFARARASWLKGDRDEAMKDLARYAEFGPEYQRLADQFIQSQQGNKSTWALEDDHRISDFYTARATQNAIKSDYASALEAANLAIQADPKNPGGYFQRGRAYWALGQNEKARDDFRRCVELGPEYEKLIEPYLSPKK